MSAHAAVRKRPARRTLPDTLVRGTASIRCKAANGADEWRSVEAYTLPSVPGLAITPRQTMGRSALDQWVVTHTRTGFGVPVTHSFVTPQGALPYLRQLGHVGNWARSLRALQADRRFWKRACEAAKVPRAMSR